MAEDSTFEQQLAAIQSRSITDARARAALFTATPETSASVSAHAAAAPWMTPQTAYALGAGGVPVQSQVAKTVHAETLNKKGGGFWSMPGHIVSAGQRAFKSAVRGVATLAESPLQVGMGVLRDVASAGGNIVAGAASGLATGAAVGLAGGPLAEISVPLGAIGGLLIGGAGGAIAQARGVKVEGGYRNPLGQSSLGVATGKLIAGQNVDLGSGFMPGGVVAEQREKNAYAAANIQGHALTPGRMLASSVLPPDSLAYNVVSGMADAVTTWQLDPTLRALKEYSGARKFGSKIVQSEGDLGKITQAVRRRMGILEANGNVIDHSVTHNFLTSDPAALALVEKVGTPEMSSAVDIWNASGRKLPPSVASALAKSQTPQEAQEALRAAINGGLLNEKAALESGGRMADTFNNFRNSRLMSIMPGKSIDLRDMDLKVEFRNQRIGEAAKQLDSFMLQGRYDETLHSSLLNKFLQSTTMEEATKTIDEITGHHLMTRLQEAGAPPETIKAVLHGRFEDAAMLKDQVTQELAHNRRSLSVKIGLKEPIPIARDHELLESLDNVSHLPDTREVRRITTPSKAGHAVYNSDAWKSSVSGLDRLMGTLWKPLNLIRPALAVRMVGMESAKMAANGLEAPLAHPLTLINMMFHSDLPGASKLRNLMNVEQRGLETLGAGEIMADGHAFHSAQSGQVEKVTFQKVVNPGDEAYPVSWAARLGEAHLDPVAKYAAEHGLEAAKEEFFAGSLLKERERLAGLPDFGKYGLESREGAASYIEQVVGENLKHITAENPALLKAVAKGHIETESGDIHHLLSGNAHAGTIEAAATKAAEDAAEKAVRAAMKRAAAPGKAVLEEGAETAKELSPIEQAANRAAQKAAREAAQEEFPAAAPRPGVKPTYFEKPLANAERTALEADLNRARGLVSRAEKGGFKTLEQHKARVEELSAQLEKDNANVKAVMDETKAGRKPKFAKEIKELTQEQQDVVDRAYKAAYAAAKDAGEAEIARLTKGSPIHEGAVDHLKTLVDDPAIKTPAEIRGQRVMEEIDPDYGKKANKVVRQLYSTLLSKPMNFLVRSPEFSQLYWKEMEGLVPLLSEDAAQSLRISMAKDTAHITKTSRVSLERAIDRLHESENYGNVLMSNASELAKQRAVDGVHDMTINMAKKTGLHDAARVMSPFMKHWQQELTQWAKIAVEHPEAFRKVQMTMTEGETSGFFYKDDQGEWTFNYPGSELVSSVVGAPFGMTGKVQHLTALTANVLPSFGPVVSIPAAKIIPNKPAWDGIRNFLLPYGDPSATGGLDAVLPPWAKMVKNALDDPKADGHIGDYTMQVAKYLVSTGDYSMDSDEEVDRTLEEAGHRAKHLMFLHAFGKAVLPSSPAMTPMVEDKDGRTVVAKLLSKDLSEMRKADYPNSAQNFIEKYGNNAFMFFQASSRPTAVGSINLDTELGYDFMRTNSDLKVKLPNTYGLFAPQSEESGYSYAAYLDMTRSGEREKLTPLEQVHLANNQVAAMQYYKVKDSLGPKVSREQQLGLAQLKLALMEKYPGFGTAEVGLAQRAETPQLISEMKKAVTIDKIAESPAGKAVKSYLQLRDVAQEMAEARGLKGFQNSNAAADIREVLRTTAQALVEKTPEFGLIFEQIFDREMKALTQEEIV